MHMFKLRIRLIAGSMVSMRNLERIFSQFLKYHIKILLGHLSVDLGREGIFKPIKLSGVKCSQLKRL